MWNLFKADNKDAIDNVTDVVQVSLLLDFNSFLCWSGVYVFDFEQVNAGW